MPMGWNTSWSGGEFVVDGGEVTGALPGVVVTREQ